MKIICQICGVQGYLQHIGKNYFRIRHYTGLKNGKAQFKYHRQDPDYARRMCEGTTNIDHAGQVCGDQNLKALSFSNENTSGTGSLVRIGHRPPKFVSIINFNQFKEYVKAKYSKVWAEAIIRYVKKYFHLLEHPVGLDVFKKHKRNNVLKSLIAYSKFTGNYSEFKQKLKDYGIKWGRTDSLSSFLRIVNNNNSDVVDWYRKAQQVLRSNEQLYLRFVLVTGLRKNEAIQSFNLVVRLCEENKLGDYFNGELQTLEHFRFKEVFLRRTKNVFISFVSRELVSRIAASTLVTYESIRKRLQRKRINMRLMDLRNYFATFMVRHGLIREEVDLLQGRIPPSIFIRHYWSPSFKELRDRTLEAVNLLEKSM